MMNRYTKRSLIHLLLSLGVIVLGLLVFMLAYNSIAESTRPSDSNEGFEALGRTIGAVVGFFAVILIGIIDAVFTSLFVYMFAYFSNKNAILAMERDGDTSNMPQTLRVLSVIEMIVAAIIALTGLLLIMLFFAF